MNRSLQEETRIAEEAAEWVGTLQQATPQEHKAFARWLTESRRNVEAFLFASAVEKMLDGVDSQRRLDVDALLAKTAVNVVPIAAGTSAAPRSTAEKPSYAGWRWAAGLAAIAVLTVGWRVYDGWKDSRNYLTGVGEQRAVRLADGSLIQLNTRSRVQIRFTDKEREVRLLEGEALFQVERDPTRPFRVNTGNAVVQALGTQFNIYRRRDVITVSVIEGAVSISPQKAAPKLPQSHDASTALVAGEEARIASTGKIIQRESLDMTRAVAWRQRRLMFKKDTLADMAEAFNRYNRSPQIRIEDAAIAGKRYTGIFDADDPESLVEYLARDHSLIFERRDSELVIRQRQAGR